MIIEDFFEHPTAVREVLLAQEMMDYKASDDVVYPGIVALPRSLEEEVENNLNFLFQGRLEKAQSFARFSLQDMKPPHWAHSDFNMCDFVCLVYLSPVDEKSDGTHLVKHRATGMEVHPQNDSEMDILLSQANQKINWEITFTCPSRFNRAFIINSHYLHAAATRFGKTKLDSRLVLTCFFNLN